MPEAIWGIKIAIDFESVAWPILMACDAVNTATLACLFRTFVFRGHALRIIKYILHYVIDEDLITISADFIKNRLLKCPLLPQTAVSLCINYLSIRSDLRCDLNNTIKLSSSSNSPPFLTLKCFCCGAYMRLDFLFVFLYLP